MINDSEDGIFTPYVWQASDQVHCDLLEREGVFWGGDVVQGDSRSVCKVLVLLTCCAPCDVVGDPGLHPFPDQVFLGLSKGLIPSRVPCGGMVMNQGHQVPFLPSRGCGHGYLANEFCWGENGCVLVVSLALINI